MAIYLGDYENDFSLITGFTKLNVYLVDLNGRSETSNQFDLDYLPTVYLNNTSELSPKLFSCPLNITPRYARLYIDSVDYLHVDLPFRPGTLNFNEFFIEANNNSLILTIGLEGEKIKPYYLNLYAK